MSLLIPFLIVAHLSGPLSTYTPGDGFNHGRKSCGGQLSHQDLHVAIRGWNHYKCGTQVLLCARTTQKCLLSFIGDSGPWGATREGCWAVFSGVKPPPGWKYRAIADLPPAAWKALGKPRFLSKIDIWILNPKYFVPYRPTT